MKIAFNPSNSSKNILDLIKTNKDIIFDLKGHSIYARGVEFKGTDTNTWRDIKINNVSIGSHTLDLRNGNNTTLTNTNGIVTINSTWRPVVDNLTSNSTTSSLSANQGRVLKALIDGKSDSGHTHDDRYLKLTGGTMLGALNLANNTWNRVGDDSYMGDCNVGGHFGIKAANTTYPGVSFFNNANAHLGSLTAYSGNIKYGAYSLQFLDNGNTSVNASTWTNPFNAYDKNAVKDGQAICVWGQSSYLSNLANGTGDMSLWLKRVNAKVATLNMVLDGEYYAGGNQRLAHASEIPTSLRNPYALTISLNGTSQGPYDGSVAKNINITPGSIGAATSGHNHDDRYLKLTGGTMTGIINRRSGGSTISGRDHAIIRQTYAPGGSSWNPIACVDTETGTWTLGHLSSGSSNTDFNFCFSTNTDYNAGNNEGNYVALRNKGGIIALTSEIPSKNSWNYDDRYYTKAESNAKYITDITTSVNKLTFTKNGSNITRDITVNVVHNQGNLTNIPDKDATTKASSGLYIYNSYSQIIGTNSYSSVLSITTGGTIQIAGNWGDDQSRNLYWRSQSDRAVSSYPWKSWRTILDSENYSSTLDSRYYTESEVNNLLSNKLNISNFNWTNLPGKVVAGNEFNIVNAGFKEAMWFNYLPINDRTKTAQIAGYHFGNGHKGYTSIAASGFIKNGSSSSYVLLGDGGHQTISSLSVNYANSSSSANKLNKWFGSRIADLNQQFGDGALRVFNATSSTTANKCPSDASILHLAWDNNGGWDTQLALAPEENKMYFRGQNNGTWNPWRTVLHDGNSYVTSGKGVINGTTITQVDNADKLDRYHESSFLRYRGFTKTNQEATLWNQIGIKEYQGALPDGLTNVYDWGSVISLPSSSSRFEIYASDWSSSGNGLYYRSGWNDTKRPWLKFIDSSNIGSQSVNYANSAGDADTVDGYHATSGRTFNGNINWSANWDDAWSDGTNKHPWYGFDHRYSNTGPYSTTISDYFGMTIKTANTLRLDCKNLLINGTNISNLNVASASKLQTARKIWGQSFDGTADVDNTLRIRKTTGSYCEGIRIQTGDGNWATIILGATADSGTNTNAWSIHRKGDNNFAISRNSSDGTNGLVMTSVGMGLGTTTPTQRLDVRGDTKITGSIRDLAIGGGIFWNPNVESATDGSDAASITLVKSGVAGGTTLVLSQMNDANDTIQFKTSTTAKLYHNSYPILTTQNTYVNNHKGYIYGTEITQVNNSNSSDRTRALRYSGTGSSEITAYQTDSSYMGRSGWASYIICNHGDGSKYYSQTIAMPFWGSPIYRRLEDGTDRGWKKFYTEENPPSWDNVINKPSSFTPSSHTHTWASITDKLVAGNEFNIVNAGFKEGMWFNYLPINDRSKTATISSYHFGNGAKGYTSIIASGFIKSGGNASQLLRADGGVAAFNWSGQSGQPTWLWGGNSQHSYYVYNPSNFRVAYASSAGNADTLDGKHASSFVRAGVIEVGSPDLNALDTYSFIKSVNSQVAGHSPKGNIGWYNVIQLVHRNGAGDGPSYIGQIALGMTTNVNDIFFRTRRTDPWKTIIHSNNYTEFIDNYYWANVKISTSANTQTTPSVNTIFANNWFRSQGDTGWYNESYGGGIHMTDTKWIRTFGGKSFYCDSQISSQGFHHLNHDNNDAVLLAGGSYMIHKTGSTSYSTAIQFGNYVWLTLSTDKATSNCQVVPYNISNPTKNVYVTSIQIGNYNNSRNGVYRVAPNGKLYYVQGTEEGAIHATICYIAS